MGCVSSTAAEPQAQEERVAATATANSTPNVRKQSTSVHGAASNSERNRNSSGKRDKGGMQDTPSSVLQHEGTGDGSCSTAMPSLDNLASDQNRMSQGGNQAESGGRNVSDPNGPGNKPPDKQWRLGLKDRLFPSASSLKPGNGSGELPSSRPASGTNVLEPTAAAAAGPSAGRATSSPQQQALASSSRTPSNRGDLGTPSRQPSDRPGFGGAGGAGGGDPSGSRRPNAAHPLSQGGNSTRSLPIHAFGKLSTPEFVSEVEVRLLEAEELLKQHQAQRARDGIAGPVVVPQPISTIPTRQEIEQQIELAEAKLLKMQEARSSKGSREFLVVRRTSKEKGRDG